jgi:hypothetical protein
MWGLQFNNGSLTGVSGQPGSIPRKISLDQNYPNPFNPTTVISYHLPTAVSVNLTVYDVLGREVETLANGMQTPGDHSVRFEGRGLASGVYFYLLKAGAFSETKKMVLVR